MTVARTVVADWLTVLRARRLVIIDLLVALIATGFEIDQVADNATVRLALPQAVALAVLSGGTLLFRRQAPLPVLASTTAVAAALVAMNAYPGGAMVLVALFTVAETFERRASLIALVPMIFFLQAGGLCSPPVTIAAWALGSYAQTRHRYVAALQERAADLEREHEQLHQIAVQAERASIARELHDVVAHSVTVMLLGVRGARDVLRTSPDVAEQTLSQVETSAEQSIGELRRILVLLRSPDHTAQMRPPPDLAQVAELISDYRKAGLPVRFSTQGQPRPLPSGVELSVYRIVEEALTNVLKHARPTTVSVELTFGASLLEVKIEDDGQPASATSTHAEPGHGILGMRERVAALGGELEAGRRPSGGFRVGARLPIAEVA
jgi:signal transduction histidine kinase